MGSQWTEGGKSGVVLEAPLTSATAGSSFLDMSNIIRIAFVMGLLTIGASAGVNCKALWMEPNPVILRPAESITYVVTELNGIGWQGEVTHHPALKVTSSDEDIVAVDKKSARLTGKAAGRVEIRVSFSECTSINVAMVISK